MKLAHRASQYFLLTSVLVSVSAVGQQVQEKGGPPTAQTASQPPQSAGQPPHGTSPAGLEVPAPQPTESKQGVEKKEQSERLLGILPHFGTTDRQDAPPLTPGGKFRLFSRTAFDPVTIGIAGAQAGVSQADNQFADYGQGAAGYGKRFGAAFADEISSNFFSNFLYPTLLKHDPRYFRLGKAGVKRRLVYSFEQVLVCHTDKGGRSFNYSTVLGALSSGGLSNAYYPASDRGFKLTMSRSGLALAYGTAGGLLSEFWPDIQRKLFSKHKKENETVPATSPQDGNPK